MKQGNNVDCLDFIVLWVYLPNTGASCPAQQHRERYEAGDCVSLLGMHMILRVMSVPVAMMAGAHSAVRQLQPYKVSDCAPQWTLLSGS